MYNNQLISITGAGDEARFRTALSFFSFPVVGYAVEERCHNTRIILFKFAAKDFPGYTALLYPMTVDLAASFLWGCLGTTVYPPEPDHDGDNVKGWRVYNEDWTHVAGRWEASFALEPVWMMAGK